MAGQFPGRAAQAGLLTLLASLPACSTPPTPILPTPGRSTAAASASPEGLDAVAVEGAFIDLADSETVHVAADAESPALSRIQEGRRVYVVDRDEQIGTTWLRVEFADYENGLLAERFGWIAPETFAPVEVACPAQFDLTALGFMDAEHRRQCAGDEELVLAGFLKSHDGTTLHVGEPAWLASDPVWLLAGATEAAADSGAMTVHLIDGLEVLPDEVEVVGHFNDPAAEDCRRSPRDPALPEDPTAEQVLWCRQRFVVTEIRALERP